MLKKNGHQRLSLLKIPFLRRLLKVIITATFLLKRPITEILGILAMQIH